MPSSVPSTQPISVPSDTSACATFEYFENDDDSTTNEAYNWINVENQESLFDYCTASNCCKSNGGDVNANSECSGWSPAVKVTMCPESCNNGYGTCRFIASNASGGSIKIESNACSNGDFICMGIGLSIKKHLDVEVKAGACKDGDRRCLAIGGLAQNLEKILIPENECNDDNGEGELIVGKCRACGDSSSFQGTFRATTECCAADGKYYGSLGNTYYDDKCNDIPSEAPSSLPSSLPSDIPSSIPSEIPSGK